MSDTNEDQHDESQVKANTEALADLIKDLRSKHHKAEVQVSISKDWSEHWDCISHAIQQQLEGDLLSLFQT